MVSNCPYLLENMDVIKYFCKCVSGGWHGINPGLKGKVLFHNQHFSFLPLVFVALHPDTGLYSSFQPPLKKIILNTESNNIPLVFLCSCMNFFQTSIFQNIHYFRRIRFNY